MAFTVERAMARREATENNCMAALEDGGCDEWEGRTLLGLS